MHTGNITYLFDLWQGQRYYFMESWDLEAPSADEAMKRLNRIAQARRCLLAANVQIAKLVMPGSELQRPMWSGAAGGFAMPWDKLLLRRDGYTTRKGLCGVSRELTKAGAGLSAALATFNQVLRECQCVVERDGKPEPIGALQVTGKISKFMRACKKATKATLVKILGREDGERAWEELKVARKREKEGL